MRPSHYQTADGTMVPTPRRIHPADVLTGASYFTMRLFDAVTDTANLAYAMMLSHRDALDEATAFLREGLSEIEALTSAKFLVSGEEYGAAWQGGSEEGYEEAFEVDGDDE